MRRVVRGKDVAAFVLLVALALRVGARTTLWYAGPSLAAVCFPLWLAARIQLGEAFALKPQARQLVTRGLYSRLRHPVYVFGTAAYFGALLALQSWPVLAAWLALTPIELVRARRENRVLEAAFGDAYREYRRKTWF
jgi:protein-S-isoprenylcysteine O-methyltransferase Ste14